MYVVILIHPEKIPFINSSDFERLYLCHMSIFIPAHIETFAT